MLLIYGEDWGSVRETGSKEWKTEPKIRSKDNYLHGVGGEASR